MHHCEQLKVDLVSEIDAGHVVVMHPAKSAALIVDKNAEHQMLRMLDDEEREENMRRREQQLCLEKLEEYQERVYRQEQLDFMNRLEQLKQISLEGCSQGSSPSTGR